MAEQVEVVRGDLDEDFYEATLSHGAVAWDIETSGLDWARDRIGTCQLALPGRTTVVVLRERRAPKYLSSLLEDDCVTKVFHHAPFDLRFMVHQWGTMPSSIACTKIASKILDPHLAPAEHSLKSVLARHLGVTISKAQQVSDWLAARLTEDQIAYAVSDVAHLLDLAAVLRDKVTEADLGDQLAQSYAYLPTRAMLDIRGAGDVFAY